jgi:hypothetical protein
MILKEKFIFQHCFQYYNYYLLFFKMTICAIFPIGICGMGKSTLCRKIREYLLSNRDRNENPEVHLMERDVIFQLYRSKGYSLRKTKMELLNYYQTKAIEVQDQHRRNPEKMIWIIFDTSNIAEDTRNKTIQLFQPQKVWNIYLCYPDIYRDNNEIMLDFIRQRIRMREDHPTFPKNDQPVEQERNILNLWDSFHRYGDFSQHFTDADFNIEIEHHNDLTYMICQWNIVEKIEEWFRLLLVF